MFRKKLVSWPKKTALPHNPISSPNRIDSTCNSPSMSSPDLTITQSTIPKTSPYREVHVLMFMWQEDDLGVVDEVHSLRHVFQTLYSFTTYTLLIPSRKPYEYVEDVLAQLKDILNCPQNLVIVYYSGHGGLLQYGKMSWCAYERKKNMYTPVPELIWSPLQTQLERCQADILIILDCCEASGALYVSSPSSPTISSKSPQAIRSGTKELIAASSFDTVTPGPGGPSFTPLLCAELEAFAQESQLFSVTELHRRLLANIIKNRANSSSRVWIYPSQSPVYVRLVGGAEVPSICLLPQVLKGFSVEENRWGVREWVENVADEGSGDREIVVAVSEIQGLALSPVMRSKVGATSGPGNSSWRIREYEEQKRLKLERRRKKLWSLARTPRRWWLHYFDIECRYCSTEGLIFAEGITKAVWWRWMEILRDLTLRAPGLEKAADL